MPLFVAQVWIHVFLQIFIPINDENTHWCMAVVEVTAKKIILLDSLPNAARRQIRRRKCIRLVSINMITYVYMCLTLCWSSIYVKSHAGYFPWRVVCTAKFLHSPGFSSHGWVRCHWAGGHWRAGPWIVRNKQTSILFFNLIAIY